METAGWKTENNMTIVIFKGFRYNEVLGFYIPWIEINLRFTSVARMLCASGQFLYNDKVSMKKFKLNEHSA